MFYTHKQLDRADHLRKDEQRQADMLASEQAQLLPVWQGKHLVGEGSDGVFQMLGLPTQLREPLHAPPLFLGLINQQAVFAQSLSEVEEHALEHWINLAQQHYPDLTSIRFEDLRVIGPALAANEGALLAFARGLTFWHDHCRFCTHCGYALRSTNAGHQKSCTNDECKHQSFPRTDPAVIMLVTLPATHDSPALCLLGRHPAWPDGVFSTLAGFVEIGESLEQAVQREVFEEASIHTTDVRYIASQPWPFPRSIMLGFEATATSTEITCDPDELDDAQWFSAEQLESFGTWGDKSSEFKLPRPDSIARLLIERWVDEQAL